MRHSSTIHEILQLGGTGKLPQFIATYEKEVDSFKSKPLAYPVIVLIDNDEGAEKVFNTVNKNFKLDISHETTEPFYHLHANLYLVKTLENGADSKSCIEDMFDQRWLKLTLDDKAFDPSKEHNADGKYGKLVFAKQIVKANADKIDFSGFTKLLDRIVTVLDDYQKGGSISLDSEPVPN